MIISKKDENISKKMDIILEELLTSQILQKGGIVIIPTDTVYGFSGIVNSSIDKKIRQIKGRDENKPFIQLIAEPEDIFNYTDDFIPPEIIKKWPGALTIIVHDKTNYAQTTAFRCPKDDWLRNIIKQSNSPIFSTSVNKSGCPILETPQAIKNTFENEVDIIVDDGEKKGALPSTLITLEKGIVKVLRQGEVVL